MKIRITIADATDENGEVYTSSTFDVDPDNMIPHDSMAKVAGEDDEGDPIHLGDIIIGAARWVQEGA